MNPEKEKLSLSLNLLEEFDTKNSEEKSARWARRGQIHSCTVRLTFSLIGPHFIR